MITSNEELKAFHNDPATYTAKEKAFIEDIKDEFAVDGNEEREMLFDALQEILGDDVDGIYSTMQDAEYFGMI